MDSEDDVPMKEYVKMMMDMIVLCATLALSVFFWLVSLTISTYYGELDLLSIRCTFSGIQQPLTFE